MSQEQDVIRNSALFNGIKKEEMETMLHCIGGYEKTCSKGEYLGLENESVRYIGLVLSGMVQMIKEDVWGNRTVLNFIKPGQLFGETFACGVNATASVTFYASTSVKVLLLPFDRVMHTCSNSCLFHHLLIENMVTMIAAKNRSLMEKIDVISKKTLREKILTYLSLQAQEQGANYFEIPLGRTELAAFLCADRSALTRELASMKEDGILDYEKNTFRLLRER